MALNDRDVTLGGPMGVDAYPGLANPTSASTNQGPAASNFVDDPTNEDLGAGAGPDFSGDRDAARTFRDTAGVVEGRPGIIESAGIDPLHEDSNKDEGFGAHKTQIPGSSITGMGTGSAQGVESTGSAYTDTAKGYASSATDTATAAFQAGKEAVFGKSE